MKNKELDLKTILNSKIDFTITKEDVLNILISEKEQQLSDTIDSIEKKIVENKEEIKKLKEKIISVFKKKEKLGDDISIRNEFFYSKYHNDVYTYFDIQRLETLKNPSRAENITRQNNYISFCFRTDIICYKHFEKDGFEGELTKIIVLKPTREMNSLLEKINLIDRENKNLFIKSCELKYKRLCLDTDKSLRSEFIKKIVNTTDLKTLLIEK
jgi:hypothetical protein